MCLLQINLSARITMNFVINDYQHHFIGSHGSNDCFSYLIFIFDTCCYSYYTDLKLSFGMSQKVMHSIAV